jgi:hypothetical protein
MALIEFPGPDISTLMYLSWSHLSAGWVRAIGVVQQPQPTSASDDEINL